MTRLQTNPARNAASRTGLLLTLAIAVAGAMVAYAITTGGLGCRAKPQPVTAFPVARPKAIDLRIGSQTFHLEVAATPPEQQRGLMYRTSMPADHGMIFIFPGEVENGFWMKNTLIPLDILYVNEAGRVVSVQLMKPGEWDAERNDYRSFPPGGPYKFAIELNAGTGAIVGVKAGDTLDIPPIARDPQNFY